MLRVREAGAEDAALLAAWAVAMALETENKRLDPEVVARGVRAVFEKPERARYFVAERANDDGVVEAAGTLMLTREWSDWRCGDWWWIQSVYVATEHRRQGVYRALYAHVLALARATPEVCGLRLYVERHNAAAQRTYTTLGMRDAGYIVLEDEFAKE